MKTPDELIPPMNEDARKALAAVIRYAESKLAKSFGYFAFERSDIPELTSEAVWNEFIDAVRDAGWSVTEGKTTVIKGKRTRDVGVD